MKKIEIRTNCFICNKKITKKGFKTYCSTQCRNKRNNQNRKEYQSQWQRNKLDKLAEKKSNKKVQCLICKRWYIQLGSHVVQRHGFDSCRQYREEYELEVKKGIVPNWYRKFKGSQAINNGTYKNLKVGKKYWFKKKDKRAGRYQRSPITIANLRERIKQAKKINKLKQN